MKLIIQIPCYNEAETLEIALNDLPKHIDGIDEIEYLIINDGSKDNTVEVAKNWGVNYVVNFKKNKGLAKGFMAGLDACLRNGADIIVNTDADNQYCGEDIEKIIRPILNGEADIVIGERPIDQTEHFSPLKKKLQHFGSWVVRKASNSDIPDAPSGFRAYSRDAAMRLNVTNEYTYTLEGRTYQDGNDFCSDPYQCRTASIQTVQQYVWLCKEIHVNDHPCIFNVQATVLLYGTWNNSCHWRSCVGNPFYRLCSWRKRCRSYPVTDPCVNADHHRSACMGTRTDGRHYRIKPEVIRGYPVPCA